MLTRSFIKSFFVLPATVKSGLTEGMKTGLKQIIDRNQMIIEEPSETEIKKIRTRFEYRLKTQSQYELMMEIFKELKVDKRHHEKLFQVAQQLDMGESDSETMRHFVKDNLKYIKEK